MQKDYFCCDICQIAFQPEPESRVPFVIECGHTFCGECIQKACNEKCPNCGTKVDSSRKKKNFHIMAQIEDCNTLNRPERIQEVQRCPISQSPMDQFCTSCLAQVYRDCFEGAHKPTHATIKLCPENENLISNILKAKQARNESNGGLMIPNFIAKVNSLIETLERAKEFAGKYKDISLSDSELRKIVIEYTETGEDTSGKLSGVESCSELERVLGKLVETKEYKEFSGLAEKLKIQPLTNPLMAMMKQEMTQQISRKQLLSDQDRAAYTISGRLGLEPQVQDSENRLRALNQYDYNISLQAQAEATRVSRLQALSLRDREGALRASQQEELRIAKEREEKMIKLRKLKEEQLQMRELELRRKDEELRKKLALLELEAQRQEAEAELAEARRRSERGPRPE